MIKPVAKKMKVSISEDIKCDCGADYHKIGEACPLQSRAMTQRHTPGPWINGGYRIDVDRADGLSGICEMLDWMGEDEMKANAALIAAAPELLRAAHNTVDHYAAVQPGAICLVDELNPCGGLEHWGGTSGACPLCSARAAIAKAEGR